MFCYQCQETAGNKGCTMRGVCGKLNTTSDLQDLLIFTTKGVVNYTSQLRKIDTTKLTYEENRYILNSMFITITNANFDDEAIIKEIKRGIEIRENVKEKLISMGIELDKKFEETLMTEWKYENNEKMYEIAKKVGVLRTENEDIKSLRELITYGIKGMCAYAEHAMNLNKTKDEIFAFIEKALLATEDNSLSVEDLIKLTLETGEYGVNTMALLDEANTSRYGHPEITKVNIGVGKNPGILISGHDLRDIEINELETKKTIAQISKTKSSFFEKINKIDKRLARLIENKREKTQINKIRKEKEEVRSEEHTSELQVTIRSRMPSSA